MCVLGQLLSAVEDLGYTAGIVDEDDDVEALKRQHAKAVRRRRVVVGTRCNQ